MTPQEKTKQLVSINSVTILSEVGSKITVYEVKEIAKQCALIAVDEILKVASFYNDSQAEVIYWQEVKQEIGNL